jgi:peptidoglycan/LPS O-acetylase OafA/YrhL
MNQRCAEESRLRVLDGWRGVSILLVLAAHLLPLGPKSWQLNHAAGVMGMVIFFTLSGFLITNFLLNHDSVVDFLIRRFFRIVPLAWLYMAIALFFMQSDAGFYLANFLFYANWPPMWLDRANGHLWSLCVEVQFYAGIAMLVVLFRRQWLFLIPLICIAVTMYRLANGVHVAINTYYRVDEILAGSMLALIYNKRMGNAPAKILERIGQLPLLLFLAASCHPGSGFLNYFRPYLAAGFVGATLFNNKTQIAGAMDSRVLLYFATISYALYVVHPLLAETWLGSGEGILKYAKRPLLFGALFFTAHISTYYYEMRWIAFGKRLSRKWNGRFGET